MQAISHHCETGGAPRPESPPALSSTGAGSEPSQDLAKPASIAQDRELTQLIEIWPTLSRQLKAGILAIVRASQAGGDTAGSTQGETPHV
ncbi:MAG: hypothetical protein KF805_12240 [Phycisphaeraceae bacterium]|nr:hypothetical protein [Phycisphaeraceae bacterium]